jgi:hypothetical protein
VRIAPRRSARKREIVVMVSLGRLAGNM